MAIEWGSAPDWIVAATALVGVVVANRQLVLIRRANVDSAAASRASVLAYEHSVKAHVDQVELERANLLLRLDEQYEGPELLESRRAWTALRARFEAAVVAGPARKHQSERDLEIGRQISAYLTDLWTVAMTPPRPSRSQKAAVALAGNAALDEYLVFVRIVNWMETVGHLCRRNLVPDADVLTLYDNVVIKTIGFIEEHIAYRCETGTVSSPRHWENARWLLQKARAFKKQRESPIEIEPSRALQDLKP